MGGVIDAVKNTDLFKIWVFPLLAIVTVVSVFIWVLMIDNQQNQASHYGKYIGQSVYRLEYEGKVYLVHARGGILEHQTNTP